MRGKSLGNERAGLAVRRSLSDWLESIAEGAATPRNASSDGLREKGKRTSRRLADRYGQTAEGENFWQMGRTKRFAWPIV
jgi:hypothetical protein